MAAAAELCRRETGLASETRRSCSEASISRLGTPGYIPIAPRAGWRRALTGRKVEDARAYGECRVKIGARIVRHGRYVVFQLAEVAVPRGLFDEILQRIDQLRPQPPPLAA